MCISHSSPSCPRDGHKSGVKLGDAQESLLAAARGVEIEVWPSVENLVMSRKSILCLATLTGAWPRPTSAPASENVPGMRHFTSALVSCSTEDGALPVQPLRVCTLFELFPFRSKAIFLPCGSGRTFMNLISWRCVELVYEHIDDQVGLTVARLQLLDARRQVLLYNPAKRS